MKARIFLLLFSVNLFADEKKLIINEQLGFVIREIKVAVQASESIDLPITLSLKKNTPDGIHPGDICNEQTKAKVHDHMIGHEWSHNLNHVKSSV